MSTNTTRDITKIAEHAKEYLRGYKSNGSNALMQLVIFEGWQRLAREELERRANRLMHCFDDDILQAIVTGQIDVRNLANEVNDEK